jgi:hypothetical protein
MLRSELLNRVLGCLRDHPHDNTPERMSARLGLFDVDAATAALQALELDSLTQSAGDHWSLTRKGWIAARAEETEYSS